VFKNGNVIANVVQLKNLNFSKCSVYIHTIQKLPSKLKPAGPPKKALKMLLASKSGGDKIQVRLEINANLSRQILPFYDRRVVH